MVFSLETSSSRYSSRVTIHRLGGTPACHDDLAFGDVAGVGDAGVAVRVTGRSGAQGRRVRKVVRGFSPQAPPFGLKPKNYFCAACAALLRWVIFPS